MIDEDLIQFLLDKLNQGYEEYKRDHPDFARVVEKEEGKPERAHTTSSLTRQEKTHCACGEWLQGFDMCSECGRINE